jgi:hypothetical protein
MRTAILVAPGLTPQLADRPSPDGAAGCRWNVLERAEVSAHDTVAVIGVGFLGALHIGLGFLEGWGRT